MRRDSRLGKALLELENGFSQLRASDREPQIESSNDFEVFKFHIVKFTVYGKIWLQAKHVKGESAILF